MDTLIAIIGLTPDRRITLQSFVGSVESDQQRFKGGAIIALRSEVLQ
jgi:hypothetical protein